MDILLPHQKQANLTYWEFPEHASNTAGHSHFQEEDWTRDVIILGTRFFLLLLIYLSGKEGRG
jgi:hypothetical protein